MQTPKAIVTLAAAAVLGAAGGAAVVGVAGDDSGTVKTVTAPAAAESQKLSVAQKSGDALSAGEVYSLARDSVVFITANVSESSTDQFGQPSEQQGQATGSGFVIDSEGYIVTNAHVVSGASEVSVKIGDGEEQRAEVVGADESTDIALLKVAADDSLKPLALGDSDGLTVGDAVYAIGNPFGLDRTLTTGVVSALQRNITAPNGYSISGVIQTDAPINPGNSGGPLLDAHGEVIGVNSQILTGSGSSQSGNVGIGFAAPSSTVKNVVEQLKADGSVEHAWLGVQMGDSEDGGAQVGAVTDGGPAADAGLRAGDVITAFDGDEVTDSASLSAAVNAKQVGDTVEVTVTRDGGEQQLTVTLGEQPAQAQAAAEQQSAPQDQQPADPSDPTAPQQADPSDPSAPQADPSDPSAPQADPQQIDPRDLLEQLVP